MSESVEDIVADLTDHAYFLIKRKEGKLRYWQDRKDEAREIKKNWFKNHKTKLTRKKGWKNLDNIEKRGAAPISDEERYAELDALPKEMVMGACRRELELFAEYYFRHYLQFPSSKLHYWLYDLFTRETYRTTRGAKWATAAPRGGAKSSLTSLFFPLWNILYKKKHFIILLSDTAGQAEDFLREIKNELLGNEQIFKHFPECCKKTDLWRNEEIITSNDVRITALGSQSKILGKRHKANRPDLIIGDDLEGQDDILSKLVRERKKEWFDKEVLKCGRVDGKTDFYVVGTIKHQDSLLSKLLSEDQYQNWGKKIFRAVEEFADNEKLWSEWARIYTDRELENDRFDIARKFYEEHEKEMLQGTKVLWPAGEPYYQLMELMQEGATSFYSEKQNIPIDRTKCLIEPDELHFYEAPEIEDRDLVYYGAFDPAIGKQKSSDFPAVVSIGKCRKTGKVFIVDAWARKFKTEAQIKEIFRKHGKYNYNKFGIETTAFQVVLKDHMEKVSRITQVYLPIVEIKHTSKESKEARIEWIYPFLRDGTVQFHKTQKELIDQVCNFTPDGKTLMHDDLVDALSMVLRLSLKKTFKRRFW